MEDLIVGTMHVQNRYNDLFYDGKENIKYLSQFLERNQIDILGTQGLIPRYIDHLKKECNNTYRIVGRARWCNGMFSRTKINFCNETNSILSKYKIVMEDTQYLARIPFYHTCLPRIVTIADIKVGKEILTFVNTHIEYWEKCQLPQLKKLLEILENISSKNLIMTGNFNMNVENLLFQNFISALEDRGISRVPMNEPTYVKGDKKETLDHIFYGYGLTYEEPERVYTGGLSDHDAVLTKVKLK